MPKEFFGKHKRRRRKHVAPYQSAPRNMSGPDQRYNTFDREAHRELDMGSSRAHTFFKDPDIQPGQAPREPTSSSYLGATEDFSSSSMELDVSVAYEQELQSQGKGDNTCNVTGLDEEDATLCIPETPEAVKKKLFGSQEEIISQSFQHKPSSLHENEFASDSLPSRIREASSTAMHSSKAPNNIPGQGSWQIKPIFNVISSFINQNSRHAEPMADSSQTPNRGVDEDLSLLEKLQNKERELERSKKKYNKLIDSHQKLQQTAQLMEKWVAEFESKNQRLLHEKKQQELKFRGEIRESRAELDLVQEKYEELIRKRQEEAFKQMRSGRWLPTEDGKVVAELARVKREIRTWARSMATTDIKFLERLDETELMGLLANLSHVAVVQHADLPRGLGTPKAPGLLLNALLAHHVCTTTFQSPFFFLDDRLEEESLGAQGARLLGEMYKAAQDSNEADAHAWRSQTLRMLLPALGKNATRGEKELHGKTEQFIVRFSKAQASKFMSGTAGYLFDPRKNKEEGREGLIAIYQGAATLSYRLWTQRTTLKCFTLKDLQAMGKLKFDADNEYLKPHSMVRYDDHDDHLKGKPITLIVHPLILVAGTDEGKDYDTDRIWANAEVWLDSK